jgi:hypothetical protein
MQQPNMVLVLTPLIMLTNISAAFFTKQYIYMAISAGLLLSSVIYHYTYTNAAKLIDKFFVYVFIAFGGYTFYTKCGSAASNLFKIVSIMAFFIFSIVVYTVGKKYECFCFDPTLYVANFFHGLMHILSSFGHNLIILFDYY